MPSALPLAEQNIAILLQGAELLERIDEQTYRAGLPSSRGGIGSQLRHCMDFYDCFLRGLEEGRIDYDRRERDELVEIDVDFARERLDQIAGRLRQLADVSQETPLEINADAVLPTPDRPDRVDAQADAQAGGRTNDQAHERLDGRPIGPPVDRRTWSRSSVGRELRFLLSHTVHHFAIIGLMLRMLGGEPPAAFGVAPSTLDYWKETDRPNH
ncbi:MAG: DinB family protein [Acidobacteriota bacterium]|nr:MAG: DinB family protein [Acidobacteriota bacterium]